MINGSDSVYSHFLIRSYSAWLFIFSCIYRNCLSSITHILFLKLTKNLSLSLLSISASVGLSLYFRSLCISNSLFLSHLCNYSQVYFQSKEVWLLHLNACWKSPCSCKLRLFQYVDAWQFQANMVMVRGIFIWRNAVLLHFSPKQQYAVITFMEGHNWKWFAQRTAEQSVHWIQPNCTTIQW